MAYDRDQLRDYLAQDFWGTLNCFAPGSRNDNAVDFCILNWCLGLNPVDEFIDLATKQNWSQSAKDEVREHIDRVVPYLMKWGQKNTMEAMAFAINY